MLKLKYRYILLLILLFIFIFRLFALQFMNIDLYVDEAYYWYWSKHLDIGYYSKPPLIAWIIRVSTEILGDNIYAIKIVSSIFYLLSSIYIFLISTRLFKDKRIALLISIYFITMPGVSYLSEVISTDALLIFFWSFTLYYFIKAVEENLLRDWILAGIGGGLGLLSKPTMIIFLVSVLLYGVFIDRKLFKNKNLYISMLISFFIYLPNLIWNFKHNFIMFHHIKQISEIETHKLFHFDKLFEFLLGQLIVFGPIFFVIYIFLIFKRESYKNKNFLMLIIFSLPFLVVISLQAFLEKANINWALPTYITASILVVYYLLKNKKLLLYNISLILNISLMIIVYFYHPIMTSLNIELNRHNDFYKRVLGWKELANKVNKQVKKYPNLKIIFVRRDMMSEMIYYLKPHPFDAQLFNPSKKIVNQFAINTNLNKFKGENFLVILKDKNNIYSIKKYFEKCQLISKEEVAVYKDFSRKAYIYLCKKFSGY